MNQQIVDQLVSTPLDINHGSHSVIEDVVFNKQVISAEYSYTDVETEIERTTFNERIVALHLTNVQERKGISKERKRGMDSDKNFRLIRKYLSK